MPASNYNVKSETTTSMEPDPGQLSDASIEDADAVNFDVADDIEIGITRDPTLSCVM